MRNNQIKVAFSMVIEVPKANDSFFKKLKNLFMKKEGFQFEEMGNMLKNDHRFYFKSMAYQHNDGANPFYSNVEMELHCAPEFERVVKQRPIIEVEQLPVVKYACWRCRNEVDNCVCHGG